MDLYLSSVHEEETWLGQGKPLTKYNEAASCMNDQGDLKLFISHIKASTEFRFIAAKEKKKNEILQTFNMKVRLKNSLHKVAGEFIERLLAHLHFLV